MAAQQARHVAGPAHRPGYVASLSVSLSLSLFSQAFDRRADAAQPTEWLRIKPKVLQLIDRGKDRYAKKQALLSAEIDRQNRQISLRPRYDKLCESLRKPARPFVPLFVDFLVLPSVKALWLGDNDVTEQAWTDALDDIKDELEQFRLDLIAHAHALVLEATTDPDERSTTDNPNSFAADELGFDLDKFFELATSFVCCDYGYCPRPKKYRGWSFPWFGSMRNEYRQFGSIGRLVTVLQHLHEYHNGTSVIYGERAVKARRSRSSTSRSRSRSRAPSRPFSRSTSSTRRQPA